MSNFKPVITFKGNDDLKKAWVEGSISDENLYKTEDTGRYFRYDPDEEMLVEITEPEAEESQGVLIWWLSRWDVRTAQNLIEMIGDSDRIPPLPGIVQTIIFQIGAGQEFSGQLIVPAHLRHRVDPDTVDDVRDDQSIKEILRDGFIGVPFEVYHYDAIRRWPGLITTMSLSYASPTQVQAQLDG